MKNLAIIIAFILACNESYAQKKVRDKQHMDAVNENNLTRKAAETTYQSLIDRMKESTDNINVNLSSVVLVQTIIHRSMTEVNEALKDAIMVHRMGYLITDIYKNSKEALELAKGNPALTLFAEGTTQQLKNRGVKLVGEVSSFVLGNNKEILINYNVRDELITKVVRELQIMNAMLYTIRMNMYWAKQRGLIKSFNPWDQMIVDDKAKLDELMWRRRILKL